MIIKTSNGKLRWDKVDKTGYYYYTRNHLTPLVDVLIAFKLALLACPDIIDCVQHTYDTVVSILKTASSI